MIRAYKVILVMLLLGILIINLSAQDSVPQLINYQGFLTDQVGKALNETLNITFRLYPDTSEFSTWKWSEEQAVEVTNGLFNVLLGSSKPLTSALLNANKYMGIKVEGELEMKPRMLLASVASSIQAEKAYVLSANDGDPENAVIVDEAGNVGIGVENPREKLDVDGLVFAKGFKTKIYTAGGVDAPLTTLSGNSFSDVPDLSITFSLSHAATIISHYCVSGHGGGHLITRLLIDEVEVSRVIQGDITYKGNVGQWMTELPAGEHTIKVEFRTSATQTNDPAGTDYNNRVLQVMVLGDQ